MGSEVCLRRRPVYGFWSMSWKKTSLWVVKYVLEEEQSMGCEVCLERRPVYGLWSTSWKKTSLWVVKYVLEEDQSMGCEVRLGRRPVYGLWSLSIGTSIVAHCYYTTLPYYIFLSIARYAGIYWHAGLCGMSWKEEQSISCEVCLWRRTVYELQSLSLKENSLSVAKFALELEHVLLLGQAYYQTHSIFIHNFAFIPNIATTHSTCLCWSTLRNIHCNITLYIN